MQELVMVKEAIIARIMSAAICGAELLSTAFME